MGRLGEESQDRLVADMADNMEGLSGVTAQSMADEDRANAKAFRMENAAAGLSQIPLLVLTSDDGLAPDSDALVHAIESQGRTQDHRNPRRHRSRLVRSPYRAGERNSDLVSRVALASGVAPASRRLSGGRPAHPSGRPDELDRVETLPY